MDSDQCKVFVGGISWETNEETLNDHFRKYGEVVDSVIMRDKITGFARGFGFVQFSEQSAAERALQEKHNILGRTVEVKRALPRNEHHHGNHNQQQNKGFLKNSNNGNEGQIKTKKIFVGGLSSSLTEEDFKNYFESFGKITDVVVMYDGVTHRPRGFGFITFDSEESVENVMQKNFHELNNKLVEVKRAVPKDGNTNNNNNHNKNNSSNNKSNMNNNYSPRNYGGRNSIFGNYRGSIYPSYTPRYGMFHGYPPAHAPPFGNMGTYPYGFGYTYGGLRYTAPVMTPRSFWNGPGMFNARANTMPYEMPFFYPAYSSGSGIGGYYGNNGPFNEKLNQGNNDLQNQAQEGEPLPTEVHSEKSDKESLQIVGTDVTTTCESDERGTDGLTS